jgi:hypothetical protein
MTAILATVAVLAAYAAYRAHVDAKFAREERELWQRLAGDWQRLHGQAAETRDRAIATCERWEKWADARQVAP